MAEQGCCEEGGETPILTEAARGLTTASLLPHRCHNPITTPIGRPGAVQIPGMGAKTGSGARHKPEPQTHPPSAQRAARPPSLRYASSVGERRAARHCPQSLRNLRRADRGGRGGRRRRSGGSAAAPEGGRAGSRSEPGRGRWGEGSRGSPGLPGLFRLRDRP